MKSKKMFVPVFILTIAMAVMTVYSVVVSIAQKPTITQKDFPFSITYTLNGNTETIEGIYAVTYTGNGGYVDTTTRIYNGKVISPRENADVSYVLSETEDGSIMLYTNFYPDYLMGDAAYDYFPDDVFAPELVYYDQDYAAYTDAPTLLDHGVQLISWNYPEPIENSFVFSHISYLSSEIVFPLVLIAACSLLAVIVFVQKDKEFVKQRIDTVSIVFNFLIALIVVPFLTIFGCLSDINGSSPELEHQLIYLTPAIALLGLATSVSLRRKGFHRSSFVVQFAGIAVLAVISILDLLF